MARDAEALGGGVSGGDAGGDHKVFELGEGGVSGPLTLARYP